MTQPTMRGHEHWTEAERLLTEAAHLGNGTTTTAVATRALAHATLAAAAPAYGWHQPPLARESDEQ